MNFHSIRNNLKVWYIQVYQELILDVLIQNYSSEIPNRKVSLNFHNVWEVPENSPKFLLVAICRFHRSASLTFSQVISSTIKVGAQRVNMINMIQNLITRPSIDYKSAGDSRQLNIDQLHGRSTGQWIESARLFLDKNLVNLINKNLWFNSIRSGSDDFTENLLARPPLPSEFRGEPKLVLEWALWRAFTRLIRLFLTLSLQHSADFTNEAAHSNAEIWLFQWSVG